MVTISSNPLIPVEGSDYAETTCRHGVSSFINKAGDKDDFSEKLAWAVCNRKKAERIGEEARGKCANLQWAINRRGDSI